MITCADVSSTIVNNIEKFVGRANELVKELHSIELKDIDNSIYTLNKNVLLYAQNNINNIAKDFSLLRNNVLMLTDLTITRDKLINFMIDNRNYYPNIDTTVSSVNTMAESVFYYNNDRLYIEAKIMITTLEAKYTNEVNRINKLKEEESHKGKSIELIKAFSDLSPTLNESAKEAIAGEIVTFITELKENSNSDYEAVLDVLKNPPPKEKPQEEIKVISKTSETEVITPVIDEPKLSIIETLWNYINKQPGIARWKVIYNLDNGDSVIVSYITQLLKRGQLRLDSESNMYTVGNKYYTKKQWENLTDPYLKK